MFFKLTTILLAVLLLILLGVMSVYAVAFYFPDMQKKDQQITDLKNTLSQRDEELSDAKKQIPSERKTSKNVSGLEESSQVIKDEVSNLIYIESGESFTVAVIKDVSKLKLQNSDFYRNAVNGDILLISSNRAIIYDEDSNKIINIVPIK